LCGRVRLPERGHGDGRLIRWRSQAGRMLGEPAARRDAGGEFAATTAQVLGERVPGGQSAWTGGGLAPRDPPGQRRFSVMVRIDPKIAAAIAAIG
jgi:hypothetical protein